MNTSAKKGAGKTIMMIVGLIVLAFIVLMVIGIFAQKEGFGTEEVNMETVMTPEGVNDIGDRIVRIESFTENDKKILEATLNLDNGWNDWTSFVPEADVLTGRFMYEIFKKQPDFDKDTFRFIFLLTPLDNRSADPQKVMSMDFAASEMKQLDLTDGLIKLLNYGKNVVYLDKELAEKMIVSFCMDKESDLVDVFIPFCDAQLSQLGVRR